MAPGHRGLSPPPNRSTDPVGSPGTMGPAGPQTQRAPAGHATAYRFKSKAACTKAFTPIGSDASSTVNRG